MTYIRNFSIIAHIDHGKSTLSDRILEYTRTIEERKMQEQVLDSMELERERGITIKMQPVQVAYTPQERDDLEHQEYILNLIDTPGHVDFSYEVSRSLAAVEGAVLLVDATQGIQAQTIANVYLALEQELEIIPVVNKVDLPHAQVSEVKQEIVNLLGVDFGEILEVSGKTGQGVPELLDRIIRDVPAPRCPVGDGQECQQAPLRALIFDSAFDSYKGVIAHIRVVEGSINRLDKIHMLAKKASGEAIEVGIFTPHPARTDTLEAGMIGYVATGLKSAEHVRVGDTCVLEKDHEHLLPLDEYKEPRPVVYASVFVHSAEDYPTLREALEKLQLADSSLTFEPEAKEALGKGFRCGFLGMLHLEIVTERLTREYDLDLVVSTPSVSYVIEYTDGSQERIYSASDYPEPSKIEQVYAPWVKLDIMLPSEFMGGVMDMMQRRKGEFLNTRYITEDRVVLEYNVPLSKIIVDFYDTLKSITSGYASLNYEELPDRPSDVTKMSILVAGDQVEALAQIVYKDEAHQEGKRIVSKLKDTLPRENVAIPLQAALGGTIVARETIAAYRKDVTAKLYGGDRSRKDKLLKKQKEGKKRMSSQVKVDIPKNVYIDILKQN